MQRQNLGVEGKMRCTWYLQIISSQTFLSLISQKLISKVLSVMASTGSDSCCKCADPERYNQKRVPDGVCDSGVRRWGRECTHLLSTLHQQRGGFCTFSRRICTAVRWGVLQFPAGSMNALSKQENSSSGGSGYTDKTCIGFPLS